MEKKKLIQTHNLYKKYINENNNLKIFNFNILDGEVPLWTDVYCKREINYINFYLKMVSNADYFGIQ